MSASQRYFNEISRILDEVVNKQFDKIEAAARLCVSSFEKGGMIHTFGTGHSHLLAEEIFYRAGGLVRVNPIYESGLMLHEAAARSSALERLPGFAKILLDDVSPNEGDVIFIFSNSGRNTVAIDMAIEAHSRGMGMICITNLNHSAAAPSRHPTGKKLCDIFESSVYGAVLIDNCGCIGDAAIEIDCERVGATSTVIGAAILQAIVCRTVELSKETGVPAEIYRSANTDGGEEANSAYIKKYKNIIKSL